MQRSIQYADRIPAISEILRQCARNGMTITYSELGYAVGMPTRGYWKIILDKISEIEYQNDRPDITHFAARKSSGYSSQIGGIPVNRPTAEQKSMSDRVRLEAQAYYSNVGDNEQ